MAPSSVPTSTPSTTATPSGTPACWYRMPKTTPESETMAPTERSMPPLPDVITTSSASASSASGTYAMRVEAR